MKNRLQCAVALLVVSAAAMAQATAQSGPVAAKPAAHPELSLTYTYIRSNAPPAGCGCFSLQGGAGSLAWPVRAGRFSLVGSVTDTSARNIPGYSEGLNLSFFAAGIRYRPGTERSAWHPFGQAIIGVAHTSGALVQAEYSAATNARAALASSIGGGLDIRLSRSFSLRLIEAEYLLTTFDNSTNDRQNSLDLSAGIVFRLGR